MFRNARFKYFVAMTLLGLLFFGMAFVFLPLVSSEFVDLLFLQQG